MKNHNAYVVAILVALTSCYTRSVTQFNHSETSELDSDADITNRQSHNEIFNHANALFAENKYEEAVAFYKQVIALVPRSPQAFFNMGTALYWSKKYPEALHAFRQAILLKDDYTRAYLHMSKLLIDMKRSDEAITSLNKVLSLDPTIGEVYLLLARIQSEKQQFAQAIEELTKGLAIAPDDLALLFELANTHNASNHFHQALHLYKQLAERSPNNPTLLYNIAYTLKKLGLVDEAMPYYNLAIELNPKHKDAHFGRGLACLVTGDFEQGWQGYEWRYNKPEQGSLRTYPQPRWDGSDLKGKTLFLHAEQGLGDTFQFIRYAQLAKAKGGIVIAAVQKPLTTLLCYCPYIDHVIALNEVPPAFDVHASIMSLPYLLKTRIDTIPSNHPYLFADEKLIHYWKKQLKSDKNFKIGICWQGNENYTTPFLQAAVAQKSIQLSQLAPLCNIPGVSVYSLQRITGTNQIDNLNQTINIITFDDAFDRDHGRFMDTAALIKNLHLVITIDTSICHLASALGTPVWNMLPNPADWRWLLDRTDSPWYPNMRLFRQPTPGDWDSVIAMVAKQLKKAVKEHQRDK